MHGHPAYPLLAVSDPGSDPRSAAASGHGHAAATRESTAIGRDGNVTMVTATPAFAAGQADGGGSRGGAREVAGKPLTAAVAGVGDSIVAALTAARAYIAADLDCLIESVALLDAEGNVIPESIKGDDAEAVAEVRRLLGEIDAALAKAGEA